MFVKNKLDNRLTKMFMELSRLRQRHRNVVINLTTHNEVISDG